MLRQAVVPHMSQQLDTPSPGEHLSFLVPCASNQMQGLRLEFVGERDNSLNFNARLPKVKSSCAIG